MSAHTIDSGRSHSEQVRTIDNRPAELMWTGLGMAAIFLAGALVGHLALQWIIGALAIAALLAVSNHHRPASHEDALAKERWLQAQVDTWSTGRSI